MFFLRSLTILDIMAATALCRPPVMYLRHIHNLNVGIGVQCLFGCDDRTLAVISQGAQLDAWKLQKRNDGELSIGELYRNGSRILLQLWEGAGVAEGIGPIISEIFRCTTVIYLHVVMSGNPLLYFLIVGAYAGVEEVKKAVPYLVHSIKLLLPHTDALNLLCWPIVVGTPFRSVFNL
jgi:hypothetical protein